MRFILFLNLEAHQYPLWFPPFLLPPPFFLFPPPCRRAFHFPPPLRWIQLRHRSEFVLPALMMLSLAIFVAAPNPVFFFSFLQVKRSRALPLFFAGAIASLSTPQGAGRSSAASFSPHACSFLFMRFFQQPKTRLVWIRSSLFFFFPCSSLFSSVLLFIKCQPTPNQPCQDFLPLYPFPAFRFYLKQNLVSKPLLPSFPTWKALKTGRPPFPSCSGMVMSPPFRLP